nr:RNA-directed DNA polymerase, eukaryota [Tanacetum cinerariifolium]
MLIGLSRKKRRSVFDRLQYPRGKASNSDDLAKISLSVYVSNFPSHLTMQELWNICGKIGTLVDVFIANQKNKLGQAFAFCRYIKVDNTNTLVKSLCNIWIGKLRLHANVARFARNFIAKVGSNGDSYANPINTGVNRTNSPHVNLYSYANVAKGSVDGGDTGSKMARTHYEDIPISISLDQESSNEFSLAVLGCYKDFRAISNAQKMCCNEARDNFLKHAGVKAWFSTLKLWHNDFVVDERLIWIEIEGVSIRAWEYEEDELSKNFEAHDDDQLLDGNEVDSETESIDDCSTANGEPVNTFVDSPKLVRESVPYAAPIVHREEEVGKEKVNADSDPFGLLKLIKKRCGKNIDVATSFTPEFLPGFTPTMEGSNSKCNPHQGQVSSHCAHSGFSLIERLQETIKVGTALGLNMEGCENTLIEMIADSSAWGNSHFDFAASQSRELSGGILCVWNNLLFLKSKISSHDKFVVVEGLWTPTDARIMWIVVYTPQDLPHKISLWSSLAYLMSSWDGIIMTMGDFNEVREAGERFGSVFNSRQAAIFNDFIANSLLNDVPLGNIISLGIPDHRPILLIVSEVDYGPTPFRFFHSWLELDGFHALVTDTWNNTGIEEANGLILFKKKLQYLKHVIRDWVATNKADSLKVKKDHQLKLSEIDAKIDQGTVSDEDLVQRRDSCKILSDLDRIESNDIAQKAKVKWALKGDENSKFFHGLLKKKRRQLAIKGVFKNGDWVEDPNRVKGEFYSHFCNCFNQVGGSLISLDGDMPNVLSPDLREFIERPLSNYEIKRAVWDCGEDRALGPDGYTFKFFTTFWDVIHADVYRFVREFFHTGVFPKGCNSSFIALILKISNARKRKKDLMVFKVDFEKAFDSLRLDYLDMIMSKLGFGSKWRNWILGCFRNAKSFVLVNGSPTQEFDLNVGLGQGDPLSPFLFILAMEGLHVLSCKAESLGLFKGVSFGVDNMKISHLMFADDVIFLGDWSRESAINLLCMLRCFYLISGLKINVNKCSIFGVGKTDGEVSNLAFSLGCGVAKAPFKYLGVLVGGNMNRCSNWEVVTNKFWYSLSLWKTRLLSVGGRLSLIKSVLSSLHIYYMSIYTMPVSIQKKLESLRRNFFIAGDTDDRNMSWVRWKKCLTSKDSGVTGCFSPLFNLQINQTMYKYTV